MAIRLDKAFGGGAETWYRSSIGLRSSAGNDEGRSDPSSASIYHRMIFNRTSGTSLRVYGRAYHAQLWLSSLERYAVPRIGKMPVSEVTSADVIGILAPIWHDMSPTARKLRQRIRAVMEWAVAMGLRPDNPCDRIGPVLGSQGNVVRHMRALPHGQVPSAIETVRASSARPVVKLAFEFLVLTATRSGEVRGAWMRRAGHPDQDDGSRRSRGCTGWPSC